MSENIKVSEVSDILRKQLEGINANVQLDEIGTVLQVSDGDGQDQRGIRREAYQTYRLHPCRRGHAGTCDRPVG